MYIKQMAVLIRSILYILLLLGMTPKIMYANDRRSNPLKVNQTIHDFGISGEISREDGIYLGLDKHKATICEISSSVIWIQIFSIYCPYCQKMAPEYNRLYKLISMNSFCRMNVKMIGIGAGNNDYEVNYFKKYYNVVYPLFPDPTFQVHKILKEPKTPFVFLVQRELTELKVLTIFDPKMDAEHQFENIKATLYKTMAFPKESFETKNNKILIKNNCLLWDYPNGRPIACLLKGSKVKIVKSVGTWHEIESLGKDCKIEGWMNFE